MNDTKCLIITFILISVNHCSFAQPLSSIAIDIGHSLISPGAISARGKPEFEFNLQLGKALQQALISHQIDAFLIGADGKQTVLKQRTAKANADNASFFISIHHDSAQSKYLNKWKWQDTEYSYSDDFSGYSLFISRENQHLEKSLVCARMIGIALKDYGFSSSTHHAEPISGENRQWADKESGVYYYDDLVVLKTAKMPAILVEAGIIINRADEENLQKDSTRKQIAAAITQGIENCMTLK